ncbi:uncharacterized protein zgc:193726 [Sardina pilchardus]|uniref:uncharacterized protein zgc:193726 n=1 Tax=Sardina pilchardus TaxID=27697 RepID=UPI002E0E3C57
MLSGTMSPAWSFSALLLGCVFGFPISFNSTQSDTRSANQSYEMNTNGTNSTPYAIFDIDLSFNRSLVDLPRMESIISVFDQPRGPGCMLPTCALSNLGNSLTTGDEIAGSLTSDPHGIGKK